jgi:hypothetical protein
MLDSSGDDRKRANIAFCLSKLNIKTLASYRVLKENFPNLTESDEQNTDAYDEEEHLAWKKYLMVSCFSIQFADSFHFSAGLERYRTTAETQ